MQNNLLRNRGLSCLLNLFFIASYIIGPAPPAWAEGETTASPSSTTQPPPDPGTTVSSSPPPSVPVVEPAPQPVNKLPSTDAWISNPTPSVSAHVSETLSSPEPISDTMQVVSAVQAARENDWRDLGNGFEEWFQTSREYDSAAAFARALADLQASLERQGLPYEVQRGVRRYGVEDSPQGYTVYAPIPDSSGAVMVYEFIYYRGSDRQDYQYLFRQTIRRPVDPVLANAVNFNDDAAVRQWLNDNPVTFRVDVGDALRATSLSVFSGRTGPALRLRAADGTTVVVSLAPPENAADPLNYSVGVVSSTGQPVTLTVHDWLITDLAVNFNEGSTTRPERIIFGINGAPEAAFFNGPLVLLSGIVDPDLPPPSRR